jgi:FkbM family methyltransferase
MDFHADMIVSHHLQQGVVFEPEMVRFIFGALRPGDHVLDLGANIGWFSLFMSQLVGPTGSVLAVEASPENINKFMRNLNINQQSNLSLVPKALSYRPGKIEFFQCKDTGQNSAWKNEINCLATVEVEATTLDEICADRVVPRLIKMDIEGSELNAITGGRQLLAQHPPFVLMEFNETALAGMGATVRDLRAFMHDFNYELFVLDAGGRFPAMVPPEFDISVERNNTNVLFSTFHDLHSVFEKVIV